MGRKVLTDLGGGKMRTASGKMLKVGQRVQTPSGVKVVMADGSLTGRFLCSGQEILAIGPYAGDARQGSDASDDVHGHAQFARGLGGQHEGSPASRGGCYNRFGVDVLWWPRRPCSSSWGP
jgi:hypothetical protein